MDLERFVESTLARQGCVSERPGADRIAALLAPSVAARLALPEDVRLRTHGTPQAGETSAAYGSQALAGICELARSLGSAYRLEIEAPLPKRERIAREIETALQFRNGIGRLESIDEEALEYLIIDYHYTALSEDRHEGLIAVATSLGDGTASPMLAAGLESWLAEHPGAVRTWSGIAPSPAALVEGSRAAWRLAILLARAEIEGFATRLARRLQRDTRRTEDYYESLRREVEQRRTRGREDSETLQKKLQAIDAESRRRRQDLERRYAIRLALEPIALLVLRISGLAVHMRLQRRKTTASARRGWNAVARELDPWMCATCGAVVRAPFLCDALHRSCETCRANCAACATGR